MSKSKKIAILGAGVSGLASAKEAMANGMQPIVFEKEKDVGGLWNPASGSIWDKMHTNLSFLSCMYSDFYWKEKPHIFPTRNELFKYIKAYAKNFRLYEHIKFNSTVTDVKKLKNSWQISWKTNGSSQQHTESFSSVIFASGFFSKPYIPTLPGIKSFAGQTLHSNQCKDLTSFKGKRVIVVGGAFSGAEISTEISKIAKSVTNVIKKPFWVVPRFIPSEPGSKKLVPVDLAFYNRKAPPNNKTPEEINKMKHDYFYSLFGDQSEYSTLLKMNKNSTEPLRVIISDGYLNQVKNKKITLTNESLIKISENSILLKSGKKIEADVIIFCTGYRLNLDFMDKEIKKALSYEESDMLQPMLLHKSTFHPKLENAAFVGMYRGPFFAIMELQARWATLVLSEKKPYPTQEKMQGGIKEEIAIRNQKPRLQFPHGNYVEMADSLAKLCDALPKIDSSTEETSKLSEQLSNGPVIPSHYRLNGTTRNRQASIKITTLANKMKEEGVEPSQTLVNIDISTEFQTDMFHKPANSKPEKELKKTSVLPQNNR